jgi:EmrB/QacA subfamily drug resistance transporter
MSAKSRTIWTFVVTSVALFMAQLDNLVVTTALPVIRTDLHASLSSLEWTVNAYTLTFAVLLLTGAALGERFGRRRMLVAGLVVFTAGSAAAALAPSAEWLIAFRAIQGAGAAVVTPLTLTLLSAAVPVERRGMALGIWGAVAGLAIATGPVVGGAVVSGQVLGAGSWQAIFWLNVPLGLVLIPLARLRIDESRGQATRLDLPGVVLASGGLFGIVLGLVRANDFGWTSAYVLTALTVGAAAVLAFVAWERRAVEPMLPMRLFASRGFSATNLASLLMFFGMFGSIFLLAQFLQTVQHYSPLQAGLRTLPWTGMPIVVSPIADRCVHDPAAGVHRQRHRHGDVLRAGRDDGAWHGQPGRRRHRVRCHQCAARTRWSVRCCRARLGVRGARRLHVRPRLRRRVAPGRRRWRRRCVPCRTGVAGGPSSYDARRRAGRDYDASSRSFCSRVMPSTRSSSPSA